MNHKTASQNAISLAVWSLAFALLVSGCGLLKQTAGLPESAVKDVVPGSKSKPDPEMLQTAVLRFADSFCGQTSIAIDEYASHVDTPERHIEALRWKMLIASSAVGIASGPNPTANMVDFVSLTTLLRAALQERAPRAVPNGALDQWLETSRELETNAWKLAGTALTPAQLQELRETIDRWRQDNPTMLDSILGRPQELASSIRNAGGQGQNQPQGVFALVGLDPMSGLDPAVREVTRARLFAERALFVAQLMPFLVRWQTEMLSYQMLQQQQLSNTLASVDRLSRAAESASQTAAGLPAQISDERKAILDALQQQEGKLRDLSAQVAQTLTAGEKMSTSLDTTLVTFTGLMKLFGVGQPSTGPPDTNSPPFNILDYAHTADQVATMAAQLDLLIKDASGTVATPALDKRIASLDALVDRARGAAKSVLNYAFLLATGLSVVIFALVLAYRRLNPYSRNTPPL